MTGARVQAILSAIAAADAGKARKRVTILGGGLAGLVAAYELSQLGHRVELFEASDRFGGRAWTHRFANGEYHELGAMRVPESHEFTRHYVLEVCGLALRPFINHHDREERFYYVRGIRTSHKEAPLRLFGAFKLSERERELCIRPGGALNLLYALAQVIDDVRNNPADLAAIFLRGPMTTRVAELEKQTLGEFLRASLDTSEALELIGAITGLEVWWHKAITMFIRDDLNGADELHEIVGGTDKLPHKLVELIAKQVRIHKNSPIRAIHNQRDKVQLVIEQAGSLVRLDAEAVICTLPFSVLRRIPVTGISPAKAASIRKLSYASAAKVLLSCKDRFWEAAGVTGGGSQSDQISRQIYYPSDRAPQEPVKEVSDLKTVVAQYQKRETTKKVDQYGPKPGVLVGCYSWGADARRLGALEPDERVSAVVKCVGDIHPEVLEDGVVESGVAMVWDTYQWAAAAFSFLEPGDLESYFLAGQRAEGLLHFAGEHCSLDQGWMQGAIESSLEAVRQVVSLWAGSGHA
ncbi:flavin monoamine oxidase family protein [Sinorhizobium meliloti]|jgi:monoamine oxidase|uniref:flavin monoamine oxidase family protein n=1 Tax=Rhizobium meliloti TaxID=382 RepID=UPI0020BE3ABB|nr:NAD(P)/FAD-dependent oxidoreductase [Sinorhizobium meliloti]